MQKERAQLAAEIDRFADLGRRLADAHELLPLAALDHDIEVEMHGSVDQVGAAIGRLELQRLLSGPYDAHSAIVLVNAGAGGTESQDWAQMLLRMLLRWCERRGYATSLLEVQAGDEAGIKSAAFEVDGAHAYGYLQAEVGVHRLVRISPFDAQKRRHTSFASVAVSPDVDDTVHVEVRDEDLRVDTYRASGAGGQHVNKTDSAVRLTHLPTGVVVACQAERSQHKNRAKAMKMLRSRLIDRELQAQAEQRAKLAGEKKSIEWGSQIRSYVLQPYRMVKDHRTGHEAPQAERVLDGDLDGFIAAFLAQRARGTAT